MEINITSVFNAIAPKDYSASVAEIGADAGRVTWAAAMEDSPDYMLLDTDDKRDAMRKWALASGGWDDAEVAAWSDVELNALFLQLIAGDMREGDLHPGMTDGEWHAYAERSEAGQVSGNIFGGPLSLDGQVYYFLEG